jgi:hypothetical protein
MPAHPLTQLAVARAKLDDLLRAERRRRVRIGARRVHLKLAASQRS